MVTVHQTNVVYWRTSATKQAVKTAFSSMGILPSGALHSTETSESSRDVKHGKWVRVLPPVGVHRPFPCCTLFWPPRLLKCWEVWCCQHQGPLFIYLGGGSSVFLMELISMQPHPSPAQIVEGYTITALVPQACQFLCLLHQASYFWKGDQAYFFSEF